MSIRYVQYNKIWIQQFHQQLVEFGAAEAEAIDGINADRCFEMLHENEIIDISYQCCYVVCTGLCLTYHFVDILVRFFNLMWFMMMTHLDSLLSLI